MTVRTRSYFKNLFVEGYEPTQADFSDLFDSFMFVTENGSNDIANQSGVDGSKVSDALNTLLSKFPNVSSLRLLTNTYDVGSWANVNTALSGLQTAINAIIAILNPS